MPVTTRVDAEMLTNPAGRLVVPPDPRFLEVRKRLYRTRLQGGRPGTFTAVLIPEPETAEDPTPVSVVASGPGKMGVLSAEDAAAWHPALVDFRERTGCHVACEARLLARSGEDPQMHAVLHVVLDDVRSFEADAGEG